MVAQVEPSAQAGDVALLVDWENLKFSLAQRERRPNVTALRDAAERFGRLVYARAYADWQDPVHKDDPASLYLAGLEPVYVLAKRYLEDTGEVRIKNSVDVKLAADCVEASHQLPNVNTYVIVSGDHGFLHVINTLRPHGKRVVVIGVSWTTAAQLVGQADVLLYYDLDVEPAITPGQPAPAPVAAAPAKKLSPALVKAAETAVRLIQAQGTQLDLDQRKVAETMDLILGIATEYREARRDFSVSLLGQEMQKRMPSNEFMRYGKGRARVYAQSLSENGLLRLVSRDFVDWLFLPGEPVELTTSTAPVLSFEAPRYDYAGFIWSDLSEQERRDVLEVLRAERDRPNVDWLTFNRIQQLVAGATNRGDYDTKNLINSMLAAGVLRFDGTREGWDPERKVTYEYRTIALEYMHPEVRRALKLETPG
jgi:uncharacterized LabA/DUF88 family protein